MHNVYGIKCDYNRQDYVLISSQAWHTFICPAAEIATLLGHVIIIIPHSAKVEAENMRKS